MPHGHSLETKPPSNSLDTLREAHGSEHLWSEHAGVSNFHDLALLVGVDLHAGFCVGVEGRLEHKVVDTHPFEEGLQKRHHVGQRKVIIKHEPLHLVELTQMGFVHRLISEDTVNREVRTSLELPGPLVFLPDLVERVGGDGGGVCTENVLLCFFSAPFVFVPGRPVGAFAVHLGGVGDVAFGVVCCGGGIFDEESVLRISGRVLLGDEECVEVPEGGVHEACSVHLLETKLQEDFTVLLSQLHEGVKVTPLRCRSHSLDIRLLHRQQLPGLPHLSQLLLREVCRLLHPPRPRRNPFRIREARPLCDPKINNLL